MSLQHIGPMEGGIACLAYMGTTSVVLFLMTTEVFRSLVGPRTDRALVPCLVHTKRVSMLEIRYRHTFIAERARDARNRYVDSKESIFIQNRCASQ